MLFSRCILLLSLVWPLVLRAETTKVACVGDSVTYGYGLDHRETEAYPFRLQQLIGARYEVRNFGKSGATLLRKGHRPYADTPEFQAALRWVPDIVVIHLGLNDTDPRDWPIYRDGFRADYSWLIAQFRSANPAVQVYVAILTPIFESHPRFLSGTETWAKQIREEIPDIAEANDAHVIDLDAPLKAQPNLFPDGLHPNAVGASILAHTVAQYISGQYGGLQLPLGFMDDMVLPHGRSITIHGTANKGEIVKLVFRRREWTARASSDGKWMIELPSQSPGGPYSMDLSTASHSVHLRDVLVGVVWVCSGQSNMDFPVAKAAERNALLATANDPGIRLFHLRNLAETDSTAWSAETLQKVNELQYFSGAWEKPDAKDVDEFSAVGYSFALQLRQKLHVPVGIVQLSVGGSEGVSWIDRQTLDEDPLLVNVFKDWRHSDFIMEWCRQRVAANLANSSDPTQRHPYEPSYNFEAGVETLRYLPVDGVIWYQGESDAENPELYSHLFPRLVASWRKNWGQNLPFFYVQLSGLDRPSWPRFRDEQRREVGEISNVGMVMSYDLGEEENVHYLHKQAVGIRLADLALHRVYGVRDVPYRAANLRRISVGGRGTVLQFGAASGQLRTSDGEIVRGFQVEDANGSWSPVAATIEGTAVILKGVDCDKKEAVAYAWEPLPKANLVSADGMPVSTFIVKLSGACPTIILER